MENNIHIFSTTDPQSHTAARSLCDSWATCYQCRTVVRATHLVNGNPRFFTPPEIKNRWPFDKKLHMGDYVKDLTPHANFGISTPNGGGAAYAWKCHHFTVYFFQTPLSFDRATAKHTHGIAVKILSVRLSVCLSVCLSNACMVPKRKHLAKKVQLWLIGSRPWAFHRTLPLKANFFPFLLCDCEAYARYCDWLSVRLCLSVLC